MMKNYQTGYWAVSDATAKGLHGKHIYLHKMQKEPSYFGGVILDHTMEDYEGKLRAVFKFKVTQEQKDVVAPSTSWGPMVEKLITEDGIHLLRKGKIGLFGPMDD